jgi:hypothetical protein
MPIEPPHPSEHRWCDVDGAHIALFCWVEQVAEHSESGALFSRLHRCGEVLGRGPQQLYIRFAGEGQLISLPPQVLRLLPGAPDEY